MGLEELAILEEKINTLLDAIKKLRAQNTRLTQDNQELHNQLEGKKSGSTEAVELKEQLGKMEEENQILLNERDIVKKRIEDLINGLDSINLSSV